MFHRPATGLETRLDLVSPSLILEIINLVSTYPLASVPLGPIGFAYFDLTGQRCTSIYSFYWYSSRHDVNRLLFFRERSMLPIWLTKWHTDRFRVLEGSNRKVERRSIVESVICIQLSMDKRSMHAPCFIKKMTRESWLSRDFLHVLLPWNNQASRSGRFSSYVYLQQRKNYSSICTDRVDVSTVGVTSWSWEQLQRIRQTMRRPEICRFLSKKWLRSACASVHIWSLLLLNLKDHSVLVNLVTMYTFAVDWWVEILYVYGNSRLDMARSIVPSSSILA